MEGPFGAPQIDTQDTRFNPDGIKVPEIFADKLKLAGTLRNRRVSTELQNYIEGAFDMIDEIAAKAAALPEPA